MHAPSLEEIIRQHILLPAAPNARGFFSVLCKVCNDHGRKGKRAGFKFEGRAVGYNCFNCGHGAGFDPQKHETMPRDMVEVLTSFGISNVDWQPALFQAMVDRQAGIATAAPSSYINLEPDELSLPPFFYRLTDDTTNVAAQRAINYLASRAIDWRTHPFYLSHTVDHPDSAKWRDRLIIPVYKGDKLIFWQGRDLTDTQMKKYLSPNVTKDNVLGGYRYIERYGTEPLYILEGWFDAFHLDGVSIFGSKLTQNQIKIINRSHRPKVVIPDRMGDGQLLAEQALELGWSISTPDIGSCKDINSAIVRYGKLCVQMSVVQNTHAANPDDDHFVAKVALGRYCEIGSSTRKSTDKVPPSQKRGTTR